MYPDVSWYYLDEKQSNRFSSNNLLWCLDVFCQFHSHRSCIYFCEFCNFYASSEPWHDMHRTWWSSTIAGTKLPPRKQKHKRRRRLWEFHRHFFEISTILFHRHVQRPNAMRKSTQKRQREAAFSSETFTSSYFLEVFSFLHCKSCSTLCFPPCRQQRLLRCNSAWHMQQMRTAALLQCLRFTYLQCHIPWQESLTSYSHRICDWLCYCWHIFPPHHFLT